MAVSVLGSNGKSELEGTPDRVGPQVSKIDLEISGLENDIYRINRLLNLDRRPISDRMRNPLKEARARAKATLQEAKEHKSYLKSEGPIPRAENDEAFRRFQSIGSEIGDVIVDAQSTRQPEGSSFTSEDERQMRRHIREHTELISKAKAIFSTVLAQADQDRIQLIIEQLKGQRENLNQALDNERKASYALDRARDILGRYEEEVEAAVKNGMEQAAKQLSRLIGEANQIETKVLSGGEQERLNRLIQTLRRKRQKFLTLNPNKVEKKKRYPLSDVRNELNDLEDSERRFFEKRQASANNLIQSIKEIPSSVLPEADQDELTKTLIALKEKRTELQNRNLANAVRYSFDGERNLVEKLQKKAAALQQQQSGGEKSTSTGGEKSTSTSANTVVAGAGAALAAGYFLSG